MKTIKVTLSQMLCKDDTTGWGTDEIYVLAVPSLVRGTAAGAEKLDRPAALTTVARNLKIGSKYVPSFALGGDGNTFQIDVEGARGLTLMLFVFEEDDGQHYEALKKNPTLANAAIHANWGSIKDYVPSNVTDVQAWLKVAAKLVTRAYANISQDDLVAKRAVQIDLENPAGLGYRQHVFKGDGGEYHLTLKLEAS